MPWIASAVWVVLLGQAQPSPVPVARPAAPLGTAASGWYVGFDGGVAAGHTRWTVTAPGASASGSVSLFHLYDPTDGSGSQFAGFHLGYTHWFPSRLSLGAETDIAFTAEPVATHPPLTDDPELFGRLRGRVGWLAGPVELYATGGLAWVHDAFTLDAPALGGTQTIYEPRVGWTLGGGLEAALAPGWTGRAEYTYDRLGTFDATFPSGATLAAKGSLQQVELGLNYWPGTSPGSSDTVFGLVPLAFDNWAIHGQTTFVSQYAPPFAAPYSGTNSLGPNAGRETWDATLYLGHRLWSGAEVWLNPELDQGFGLSDTIGVAGFTSGEAYKVGFTNAYLRVPRLFVRQTFDLGGESQKVDADLNQLAGTRTADRLVVTVGKFGVTDLFDTVTYAHDPRNDFMNWALIDAGTFDYAADAWGFTEGAALEWYQGGWTTRVGLFDLSDVPNSVTLDQNFHEFQFVYNLERDYQWAGRAGKLALVGFVSHGRMGRFDDALALSAETGEAANTADVRRMANRPGLNLTFEQEIADGVAVFARAGWANGDFEPYEFSDIDRTISGGLSASGRSWGRDGDTFGLAGILNGISASHTAYLAAGGLGILVGDGQLPHPGPEEILETYYRLPIKHWQVTGDYQLVINPAYNRDRGPVSVVSFRLRAQF